MLKPKWGPVSFTAPIAYQEINGDRSAVQVGYVLSGNSAFSNPDTGFLKTSSLIDFDGDGTTEVVVYHNGAWFILNSSEERR